MRRLLLAALAFGTAANAEVKSSTAGGFELENKFVVAAPPAET